jgi:hypothetical protein
MVRPCRAERLAGNQDTSFLKILALAFMMVDHLGAAIFPGIIELRIIGRMAFPLYAWCLVVGSVKTKNTPLYGSRLLALGLISQPLYMMALSHTWTDFNILFSLLVGLIAIYGIQVKRYGSHIWAPALCFVLLGFAKLDYGWRGLAFILVLYGARQTRPGLVAAYMAYSLFWGAGNTQISSVFGMNLAFLSWPGIGGTLTPLFRLQGMVWLSLPLIAIPTRTKIRMPHWLGYALYPLHLVVLIIIKLAGGVAWPALLRGF